MLGKLQTHQEILSQKIQRSGWGNGSVSMPASQVHKHEDLSSDPQNLHKKPGSEASKGEYQRQNDPGNSLVSHRNELMSFRLGKRPCLKKMDKLFRSEEHVTALAEDLSLVASIHLQWLPTTSVGTCTHVSMPKYRHTHIHVT